MPIIPNPLENKDNQREDASIAYLAGIIDGEGTIRIHCSKGGWTKYQPMICFINSNRTVVELVARFLNSSIYVRPSDVQDRKKKICYRTQIVGMKKTIEPLQKLLPYLVIKRKQAELCLDLAINHKKTPWPQKGVPRRKKGKIAMPIEEMQWRESLYLKCKELNSAGRPQRLNEETPQKILKKLISGEVIV